MAKYELMVILPGDQTEKECLKQLETVKSHVTEHGGEIVDSLIWGKRDLAYKIEGQETGFYAIYHFMHTDKAAMKDILHDLKLNQNVMRELLMQIDENYTFADFEEDCKRAAAAKEEAMSKRKKKGGSTSPDAAQKEEAAAKKSPVKAKKSSADEVLDDPDLTL